MKLFQTVQILWDIMGISSNQSAFNRKTLMGYVFYAVAIGLCLAFIFLGANDFMEYANASYQTVTMVFGCSCLINITFRKAEFFKFIEHCEKILNRSEYEIRVSVFLKRRILDLPLLELDLEFIQFLFSRIGKSIIEWHLY